MVNNRSNRVNLPSPAETMRVGLGTYKPVTDEFIRFANQIGVDDVFLTPHRHEGFESALPLGEVWSVDRLTTLRNRANEANLRFYAAEKMPVPLYEILLAEEERGDLIEIVTETIRNMGEANIPVLGYSGHPPDGAVRTTREHLIRGDAQASAFSVSEYERGQDEIPERNITEEELWEAYEEFLTAAIPAAEKAGVTLGVHPSDPPVPKLDGIPLLFRNRENFERALGIYPSENHGLKLCLGCWSEMGEDLPDIIRQFGASNDIVYVHFRDVVGTVPEFHETFIDDEAGNYDEYEVMKALHEIGFRGVMTPDHVPLMEGESDWEFGSTLGRSYTAGYLKGLLKAIKREQ